jgi:hypothetical protein
VGSVKRLTAISTQLAELDFAKAPTLVAISGAILSLKNGVANENRLIVPAAMITILCQQQ